LFKLHSDRQEKKQLTEFESDDEIIKVSWDELEKDMNNIQSNDKD